MHTSHMGSEKHDQLTHGEVQDVHGYSTTAVRVRVARIQLLLLFLDKDVSRTCLLFKRTEQHHQEDITHQFTYKDTLHLIENDTLEDKGRTPVLWILVFQPPSLLTKVLFIEMGEENTVQIDREKVSKVL